MTVSILALFITIPAFATDPDPVAQKTVASKAYVDTKQDIIQTGNVLLDNFDGSNVYVPGLVAYDSTTQTIKGNQIGILDRGTLDSTVMSLEDFGTRDDLVPTVAAVQGGFDDIWAAMPDDWTGLNWDSTLPSAINAYSITFDSTSTHVDGNWPRDAQGYLVRTQTFANALALKQNKIPATLDSSYHSVLTDGDTDGAVGKLRIITADDLQDGDLVLDDYTHAIPNTDAVQNELVNHWQPKITTGLVTFHEPEEQIDYTVPALVSYGTGTNNADGVLGNKIGILGSNESWGGLGSWEFLDIDDDSESAYLDNFVPTVRAVASSIQRLQWNSKQITALNAYSTAFGNAATDWDGSSGYLISSFTFANALALKQNKLGAKASNARAQAVTRSTAGNTASAYITAGGSVGLTTRSGAPAIIGYVNGTAVTDSTAMTTFTTGTFGSNSATNQDYIKNALVSLELLKDVYSALHTEIQNSAPTGTANTLANYDSTGALGTGVATYDGSTTYDSTNDASKVAIMSAVQRKKECGGYETGHENDPDYCWLWILPD